MNAVVNCGYSDAQEQKGSQRAQTELRWLRMVSHIWGGQKDWDQVTENTFLQCILFINKTYSYIYININM